MARKNSSKSSAERVPRQATPAHTASAGARPLTVAPLMIVSAVVLAVVCAIPVLFWGNPYPRVSFQYWVFGTAIATVLAVLAVFVPAIKLDRPIRRLLQGAHALSPRVFATVVGSVAIAQGIAFAVGVFKRGASTSDELAQLWQARILLSGRWSLPLDPHREFFSLDTVVDAGSWYSQFPIGGPALLALGTLFGAPWIVNPLLFGLATVAMYAFGRRVYGEPIGRTIAVVFALAPSVSIMSGTMLNHLPTLCLATLALVCLVEWEQRVSGSNIATSSWRWAAGIGVLLGMMVLFRPLDAVVFATVVGLFQLTVFVRHWQQYPRRLWEWIPQTIGGVIGASPAFIANLYTTGNPLHFGYEVNWGVAHGLGFHVDPYGVLFTPAVGLERSIKYISELNMFVTAWPVPVMALVVASFLCIRKSTKWDGFLLGVFAVQVLAYASYWGTGEFLGPRFLFTSLFVLLVYVARLPHALFAQLPQKYQSGVLVFFAACIAITWGVPALPLNGWGLTRIAGNVRQNLRLDPLQALQRAGVDRAVVFLREPFSARMTRRLWGAGISRSATAILLSKKDACQVFDVLNRTEGHAREDRETAFMALDDVTLTKQSMQSADGLLTLASPSSLTPACRAEFNSDSVGAFVPFGVGLVHEPLNAKGRIDGDIVYAADLGADNEWLRERFGDRPWYRLMSSTSHGALTADVVPYVELTPPSTIAKAPRGHKKNIETR